MYQTRIPSSLFQSVTLLIALGIPSMIYSMQLRSQDSLELESCMEPWVVEDGSAFSYTLDKFISFGNSKYQYGQEDMKPYLPLLKSVRAYLQNNSTRGLYIYGYFSESEKVPNLGMKRAHMLKVILLTLGVDERQLRQSSKLIHSNCLIKDKNQKFYLKKGVDFRFFELHDKVGTRMNDIRSRLKGKRIVLYFDTNQEVTKLTPKEKQHIEDIVYYLQKDKSANLQITGHTDSQGAEAYNMWLSKRRALFVQKYIHRIGGIDLGRMRIYPYGLSRPVASDTTRFGRAKNLRVEILLY